LHKQSLEAIRIGALFYKHCERGDKGTVHSIFRRVANIVAGDDLIALAVLDCGGSSRFLTVAALPALKAGEPCALYPDRAEVGNCVIAINRAPIWRSPLAPDARGAVSPEMIRKFKAAIDGLDGDYPNVSISPDTIKNWVGYGNGLTPSGDDALVGFLAVYNHMGNDLEFADGVRKAVIERLGSTTLLSARLLRSAVDCDYHEYVAETAAILCGASGGEIELALGRLLKVGASSGPDIARGMMLALDKIME
jgi:hypothetical protein